jgi:hypothetical protein
VARLRPLRKDLAIRLVARLRPLRKDLAIRLAARRQRCRPWRQVELLGAPQEIGHQPALLVDRPRGQIAGVTDDLLPLRQVAPEGCHVTGDQDGQQSLLKLPHGRGRPRAAIGCCRETGCCGASARCHGVG